ncbi:hypothetical protein L228DRAFT_271665 [Xylona heveae TC161]|uniref:Uncharacterized protein n=1 Tax=Xylona heveae (strain CBS 132557 / TC161) TaxID=1328760 RepID=A0A164ZFJ9_XYLHT|nr:hypothetical protein L228DRAFT_271665 [Xylona heveae TC161]KZF19039.1 hypothetical protein L228DRAFT_271665 [Xylona heveae TC161]
MPDDREQRIDDALASLVEAFLPIESDEDEAIADERHDVAFERARSTLRRTQTIAPSVSSDVNAASDLIKRKLIRDNALPDRALRFSTLYSRLLTQPVLLQKWGILYFLHQVATPEDPPRTPLTPRYTRSFGDARTPREPSPSPERETTPPLPSPRRKQSQPEAVLKEAFSQSGLPRLPARDEWQRKRADGENGPEEDGQKTSKTSFAPEPSKEKDLSTPGPPSEQALLRDLPFTLQGLSSTNLQFTSPTVLALPNNLPPPIISLIHALAEPALLYKELAAFVESSEGGLVGQSLRAAMVTELRSYLGLVATLEGEIRRALAMINEKEPRGGIGKSGVTLKRCVIWTREATLGLRLMSLIVEESKDKKGGQLISLIHSFSTSHGDPFVSAFAERLLTHVTRPFYDMLRQWIYDGELCDPYLEFFVFEQNPAMSADASTDTRKAGATSVWEDKYKLEEKMTPSIITMDFAKKVFLIGKSLNFIRYGCGDSNWVENYSKSTSKELRYEDTATLEASIDEAYKTTMARLIHLMADKFKLFEHLKALKKYILLGQGDFIALLMESLASNLDRPGRNQYRHTLTAQLEHAIRGSNAQYDSDDILRRLDARMLELSVGDTGWDLFTLEYKIDAPVDVIVTPFGYRQYLKVFNFLWRVKRVEFALGSIWRRCMTGARGVLSSVEDKVGEDWKRARCAVAEMIHFVNQLQYYILFEVIESSWDALQAAVSKPRCTLDDLIEAHAKYLESITHKGLLGSAKTSRSNSTEYGFLAQLHEILKVMLAYKDAVDGLYSFSVAEFTRRQELNAKIETRTAQGKWGMTEHDDDDLLSPDIGRGRGSRGSETPFSRVGGFAGAGSAGEKEDQLLPSLRQRLKQLSAEFRANVNVLLGDLAYQPDLDMRFLGVVMNFNDVYQPVKRKRRDREREPREHREHREHREQRDKVKDKQKDADSKSNAGGDRDRDRYSDREREKEKQRQAEKEREREKRRLNRAKSVTSETSSKV